MNKFVIVAFFAVIATASAIGISGLSHTQRIQSHVPIGVAHVGIGKGIGLGGIGGVGLGGVGLGGVGLGGVGLGGVGLGGAGLGLGLGGVGHLGGIGLGRGLVGGIGILG